MELNEFKSKFGLGQLVYINNCIDMVGVIDCVRFETTEPTYRVQWFNNSAVASYEFNEWQLASYEPT